MSTIREIFIKLGIDTAGSEDALEDVDKKADQAAKSLKELDARNEKLKQGFKDFGSKIADGAKVAATAIAAATTGVALFFDSWSQGAQQVERTANSYGLTAQTLQELEFVTERLGGQGEAVTEVFKEMAIRITEVAETGTGPATDALTLLGLRAEELKKLKPEDQFNLLADAIAGVGDAGTKIFLKDSLFGEEGAIKIGNMLDLGSKGIAKMRAEAVALGVVLDGDAIKAAKEFQGTVFTIKKTAEGLSNEVAARLLPRIKDIADRFLAWATANREVIATRIESLIVALVEGVAKLGPALANGVDLLLKMSDAIGGVDKAIYAAAGAWAVFQAAGLAALGPIGIAVAALVGSLTAGVLAAEALSAETVQKTGRLKASSAENESRIELGGRIRESMLNGDLSATEARQALELFKTLPDVSTGGEGTESAVTSGAAIRGAIEKLLADANPLTMLDDERKLGKIKKPGKEGPKEVTAKSLLLEQQRKAKDSLALQQAIDELDRARPNSEGAGRLLIEQAKADALQRLSGTSDLSINQLIASAVGQGTGFGGAQLKPAGLGTTINHIDASITFNVGGVEISATIPSLAQGDPQASGVSVGNSFVSQIQSLLNAAFQAQRGQIVG